MHTIHDFLQLIAQLRDPQSGCPWDIKQNFHSMLPCLLEETYEVAEAIQQNDRTMLREELGDLLLQVVFLSQLATEEGSFTFQDVLNDVYDKIVYRHPHVFGGQQAQTEEEALAHWEKMKGEEKKLARQSCLDDLPYALPALTRAQKLQKRCAKVGFDWDSADEVLAKVEEELIEVKDELTQTSVAPEKLSEELGDLLFASVNLCRHHKIDAESCLREANAKFERRFRQLETRAKTEQRPIESVGAAQLNRWWDEVKANE